MDLPRGCTGRSDCRCGQPKCLAREYAACSIEAKISYKIHGKCLRTELYLEHAESAKRMFRDSDEAGFKRRIEEL